MLAGLLTSSNALSGLTTFRMGSPVRRFVPFSSREYNRRSVARRTHAYTRFEWPLELES